MQMQAQEELKRLRIENKHLTQELKLAETRFDTMNSIQHTIKQSKLNRLKSTGDATAIFVLSDWHLAETVDPSTINNLNKFDIAIAKKRVQNVFERAVMMLDVFQSLSKINELVVAAIGDFISGALHDDQRETDEISPTESIMLCEDLLVNGLRFLKREAKLKNVLVATCYGNHGRTTSKPRAATAHKTSYEQLMYWHLAKTVKEFNWKVDNGYHNYVRIYERDYRLHHGDCIKYLGGIGGLQIPAMKAIGDWDRTIPAYFDIFGHYHTTSFARKYSSNGSIVGYNAYAMRNKCAFEEPSQNLIISSRKRGNVLSTPIFAD